VTVDKIVLELARIAFSDVRNALDWGMKDTEKGPIQFVTLKDSKAVDDDTARVVSEVWQTNQGIRFKLHDKPQALERLGRHLGMFKEEQKGAFGPIKPAPLFLQGEDVSARLRFRRPKGGY
jgi:phage terminase small subunit